MEINWNPLKHGWARCEIYAKGNIFTVFPPIISGSGIQAIGGGNITIAATAVIGASNIQASASRASGLTDQAGSNAQTQTQEGKQKSTVSMLTADVVGYGECSVSDVREGKPGCG